MRALGILLAALGLGLGWLSFGDRRSPLALAVVELDGRLGFPLAVPLLLAGLALALWPRRARAPTPPPRQPAAPRPAEKKISTSTDLPAETEGWLGALSRQVSRLPLEQGAKVLLDAGRTPPLRLVLERQSPERVRRSVESFAELLAAIPTPPRAAVSFEGCVRAGPPWEHQVVAALRRSFPSGAFRATQHEETVEILFQAPDPRWAEAARAASLRRS